MEMLYLKVEDEIQFYGIFQRQIGYSHERERRVRESGSNIISAQTKGATFRVNFNSCLYFFNF